jgi:hypothetical protein
MTLEMDRTVSQLNQLRFCQCSVLRINSHPRMVRVYPTALDKDLCILRPLRSARTIKSHMAAVGLAGLAIANGVPIYQSFYKFLLRAAGDEQPRKLRRWDESLGLFRFGVGLSARTAEVTTEARMEFFHSFGTPPPIQLRIESFFNDYALAIAARDFSYFYSLLFSDPVFSLNRVKPTKFHLPLVPWESSMGSVAFKDQNPPGQRSQAKVDGLETARSTSH